MVPILVSYIENEEKTDRWRLERSVTYETKAGKVTVPRGYVTDFASVPMALWSVFHPIGRSNRACLLHDWWYDNRLFREELGDEAARLLADQELRERLDAVEPSKKLRNYIMYLACRWFGKAWWDN